MTRFIFFCMAIIALSFIAVPVFNGIAKQRDTLLISAIPSAPEGNELSFNDIYDIAASDDTAGNFNPEQLNNIAPAAGDATDNENIIEDAFSSGFTENNHSAF